jgi:hypothetical protein
MKMSKIFIDWAVKKFPNDQDFGRIVREFYHLSAQYGNTPEGNRRAEEEIMVKWFNLA